MCQGPGFKMISQGAEARVYRGEYLGRTTLKKERFVKKYRHSDLDDSLTKERIRSETRAIIRAKNAGVKTPAIYLVDLAERTIYMEFVDNAMTLKELIEMVQKKLQNDLARRQLWMNKLGKALGSLLSKLHAKNIIHGDLTTSNILVLNEVLKFTDEKSIDEIDDKDFELLFVLIDFGLARVDSTAEDKAVDLYVFERSLISSHSEIASELFTSIMSNYEMKMINKSHRQDIISKYQEVRARGRKRLMIG